MSTDNEEVLLNNKVFFPAEGLSSALIEATVVVSALVALCRWVERTPPPFKTWVWSDSLGTMVKIPLGQCLQIPGDVVDKLMVWVGLCAKLLSIEWGWVQAQHDSKKKDWISQLNDNMDAGAKEASGGRGTAWRTPEVWTETGSVFLTHKGRLVVNHKKFLQG